MLPLVLYDIPSTLPGNAWSANSGRTRFALGYKNLPYDTVWVEYPDIAPTMKRIGASPGKRWDGGELYTIPVLSDPNTGALVTDSWVIAEYLDKTYPEKPLIPKGSLGLIRALESAMKALAGDSIRFTILRTSEILNPRSREFFVATRASGNRVDEWSPEGPTRDAHWVAIEKDFYGSAKTWFDQVEGKWLMGDTFSYADVIFAARCRWFKRVHHDDEWKRIASLRDGKWEKWLVEAEKECNLAA